MNAEDIKLALKKEFRDNKYKISDYDAKLLKGIFLNSRENPRVLIWKLQEK